MSATIAVVARGTVMPITTRAVTEFVGTFVLVFEGSEAPSTRHFPTPGSVAWVSPSS